MGNFVGNRRQIVPRSIEYLGLSGGSGGQNVRLKPVCSGAISAGNQMAVKIGCDLDGMMSHRGAWFRGMELNVARLPGCTGRALRISNGTYAYVESHCVAHLTSSTYRACKSSFPLSRPGGLLHWLGIVLVLRLYLAKRNELL